MNAFLNKIKGKLWPLVIIIYGKIKCNGTYKIYNYVKIIIILKIIKLKRKRTMEISIILNTQFK